MSTARQETRTNYDRLSHWYDLISGSSERPARTRGMDMLDIQPGERVLEIGCGTGEALSALAARAGPSGQAIGFDLSSGMLGMAQSKLGRLPLSNITLIQGDSALLPFAKETFNAVFMGFTLELFDNSEVPVVLEECSRVLRPGGRLGVVSLLEKDRPGVVEALYAWAHLRWPSVIDCHPIRLFTVLHESGLAARETSEQSLWGLRVGIAIAQPM